MRRPVIVLCVTALVIGVAAPAAVAARQHGGPPARYLVGSAVESINPPQSMIDARDFFLGGYGFSSGRLANQVEVSPVSEAIGDRYATGILGDGKYGPQGDGVHTRALAVSDGAHTLVLSQIETQGYFAAYKQGPFGIEAIRKDAAAQIAKLAAAETKPGHRKGTLSAPAPTAAEIVVDSDHSHGGPDTVGVWGGVPTAYLRLVHDRTVTAIVTAWQSAQPADLRYGVVHGGVNGQQQYPATDGGDRLLGNQFSDDPNNQAMDDEVRVLQAVAPDGSGHVLATYVNFSAHPTVLGADNTKITGDYVGRLDAQIQQEFGGFGMDQVATLGRTQPTDRGCPTATDAMTADAKNLCALDDYAARVLVKVKEAVAAATPLSGTPAVAMSSYLMTDPATSPVLIGVLVAGTVIGAPAGRAANPPWSNGNLIGTTYFVGRIGDVLLTGGPGEMYPQIWQKVKDTVTGDQASGITSVINIGTAGDFLGYIIAPLEAYPEPIEHSMLNGTTPDPIGNDNYFFNISHTFGERLTCDLLRGAGDVVAGDAQKYWSTYDRCPAFADDLALPAGQDTQFPEQPDLSGTLTHM